MTADSPGSGEVKPRVAICWPNNGPSAYVEFLEQTWVPLKYERLSWCEKVAVRSNAPSLPLARNALVSLALEAKADYIFFVDGDIVFEGLSPNEALRILYEMHVPIAGGLYMAKKESGVHVAMWYKDALTGAYHPMEDNAQNGPILADATGLGCCLIRADIFRSISMPFFHWERMEDASEDFYFFEKASGLGPQFRPTINRDVRLSHIGTMMVDSRGKVQRA